jgi:1A family penicillin-binding protein
MPFGKKTSRFSSQKYSSMGKSRTRRTKMKNQSYPTRHSNKRSASGFSLATLNPKNFDFKSFKHKLKELFTTKEGLKKVGLTGLVGLGLVFALFIYYSKDLPSPNKINARMSAQSTQIFDRNGKLLYEIHGDKNRIMADWNEIPQYAKDATVAVEDKDFYKHSGFSIRGILRAVTGVVFRDSSRGGGSTITQQFVKNALLTNEHSYTRKIKEVILAIAIEQRYKKDDILKMYLNEIPYGSNAYGVKVAAKTYFNKDLKDLTLEEAALLASLPQAPTYYSPYGAHKDELLARKNTVLEKMADQKFITKEQAEEAKNKEIVFSNNAYGSITAPHFVMYVKEKLVEKYGEQTVNEGGLKVYTTLDATKQQYAEDAVATNVDKNKTRYNASNASLVAMDPKNGQILAMVGSRDFFNQDIDGNVNVALMDRQPGSSFKPLVYATLFKSENWGPGSIMYDLKTDFGGGYIPNNYNGAFVGPLSIRSALGNSLNIPAVKALYIAGMDSALDTAHAMGITTLNDKSQYGLSLVLGAGEVKLIDMVSAYSVFANEGSRQDPTWMIKIEDNKGKTIDEYKDKNPKRILDAQIAYLISNILSDDGARSATFGTGSQLTLKGRPVAAKTGTTNDYKDAWTMGYTPSLVAGVWAGNNDNSAMTRAGGSIAAAPIWHDFMLKALGDSPAEQFKRPSGIKTVTIDAITGRKPSGSSKTITDIFPSWYKIPDIAGVSQEVRIDTSTGKIATDSCPAELVVTKTFNPITAEIPTSDPAYSRWFAPIQAWAAANGFSTNMDEIPKETCDIHTGTDKPTVKILSPVANSSVAGKSFDILINTTSTLSPVITVTIDGKTFTGISQGGGDFLVTAKDITAGRQKITATVKDSKSQSANTELNIIVK